MRYNITSSGPGMFLLRVIFAFTAALLAGIGAANAEVRVAASIKPVHSLVAAVMEGIGEPALIVQGAGSPHTYSLKPSQAVDIEKAQIIFWIGPEIESFLQKPIETIGANAEAVALGSSVGIITLKPREGGTFEIEYDESDASHAHDGIDPHLWLDPENAKAIVSEIAKMLSQADPANGARYKANAAAELARLDALEREVEGILAPVRGRHFIVFHDAYQYFEHRFGLAASGSITVNPEIAPSAARIREIQSKVRELGAVCVFAEPEFEPRLVTTVTEGSNAKSGVLDPLGASLKEGPDLYFDLIRNMARSLRDCLSSSG